jgi:anti-sigma-K factor RskA
VADSFGRIRSFVIGMSLLPFAKNSIPNADYVAVLTARDGEAKLTALTASDGQTLWLQWQDVAVESDTSIQLWALSKRDGQIRSIAVFDSTSAKSLMLDQANLRLIKDAEKLILTSEELGGSAMDEPSENVIASGVCVRLTLSDEKRG